MRPSNITAMDHLMLIPNNARLLKSIAQSVGVWNTASLLLFKITGMEVLPLRSTERIRIDSDTIHVKFNGSGVKLKFDRNNHKSKYNTFSEAAEQFIREHYDMDVKGRTVIDIGASNGDTLIYFTKRGARHVYGLEPYPYAHGFARENVRINNVSQRVHLFNEACMDHKGWIILDPKKMSTVDDELIASETGRRIKVSRLCDITARAGIGKGGILKIDAENAEYPIILSSDNATLRKFERIDIEYHDGYLDLERKLMSAGFDVSHTGPAIVYDSVAKRKALYFGDIKAKRKGR